jgi:hypothetical protein
MVLSVLVVRLGGFLGMYHSYLIHLLLAGVSLAITSIMQGGLDSAQVTKAVKALVAYTSKQKVPNLNPNPKS